MNHLNTFLFSLFLITFFFSSNRLYADKKNSCGKILTETEFNSFTDGFCDDNTFRIKVTVNPEKKNSDTAKQKELTEKKAILEAQYRIIEKFHGACIATGCGEAVDEETLKKQKAYNSELIRTVKAGTVKYIHQDRTGRCSIIFEITRPGLKEFVLNCY